MPRNRTMFLNSVIFTKNPWQPSIYQFYTPKRQVYNLKCSNTRCTTNFHRLRLLFPLMRPAQICNVLEVNGGNFMKTIDTLIYKNFILKPKRKRKDKCGAARCAPAYLNVTQEVGQRGTGPSTRIQNYKLMNAHESLPNMRFTEPQLATDTFYEPHERVVVPPCIPPRDPDEGEVTGTSSVIDVEHDEEDSIRLRVVRSDGDYFVQLM